MHDGILPNSHLKIRHAKPLDTLISKALRNIIKGGKSAVAGKASLSRHLPISFEVALTTIAFLEILLPPNHSFKAKNHDGDADATVINIANNLRIPIISSDSDYFMMNPSLDSWIVINPQKK